MKKYTSMDEWITPPSLQPGDTIAVISPAGAVRAEYVHGAAGMLRCRGYNVRVMPHALGHIGTYSGTVCDRISDFAEAWHADDVKAVLCSRGGYGAVALLQSLDELSLADNPKWLIGFSDISALHALLATHHVHSMHGPMAKYLSIPGVNLDFTLDVLAGKPAPIEWQSESRNIPGHATGRIIGGNMAVLSALMGTQYDIYRQGDILVIEDISEPIYKVERMLWQLRLSGALDRMQAVIVGDFCGWEPDRNFESMQRMISAFFSAYGMPVAFDAPIGHAGRCLPWIEGAKVEVEVADGGASVRYV